MTKRIVNGLLVKTDGILSGDDLAPSLGVKTHREWIRKVSRTSKAARFLLEGRPVNFEMAGEPVTAVIEHGRWVAHCNATLDGGKVCLGCENVEPSDPIFFCFSCCNESSNRHVRPVQFPNDAPLIESALMKRGNFSEKNWLAGETLADLEAQTIKLKDKKGGK